MSSSREEKATNTSEVQDEKCELAFASDHFEDNLHEEFGVFSSEGIKKGQATYIAPLQPSTLATFRSWGISTGAGRIRLALGRKGRKILSTCKRVVVINTIKRGRLRYASGRPLYSIELFLIYYQV